MTRAVVMAGGRSERMKAGPGGTHKGLVPVLGVPMLERNVCTLLAAGFRDVVIVVAHGERELLEFVESRCRLLIERRGGQCTCVVERSPLGTIGACSDLGREMPELLVVNVDNLTSLDLADMVRHHRSSRASMTVATHWQPFRIPYGEVTVEDGGVTGVLEKPVKRFHMSSGTYVLGPNACAAIPADTPFGAPALVEKLRLAREPVAAYQHDRPWIDVNDAAAVARAEALIMEHACAFELWRDSPERRVSLLLLVSPAGVWLVPPSGPHTVEPQRWSLPQVWTDDSEIQSQIPAASAQHLITFDEPDPRTGRLCRYRVMWMASSEAVAVPIGAPVLLGGTPASSEGVQDPVGDVHEQLRPA
jgi:mannose-1-phosphate guanylyltransferase/phosphomannomutase